MQSTSRRLGHGSYFVTFPVSNHLGAVGFTVASQGLNCWTVANWHDVELNCWTSKRSMIDWLESKTEQQLINLAEQK